MVPETRYTKCGRINIAYQVVGDGPVDIVLVPGWVSNIDVFWEEPRVSRFLNRLASFSRLILFDKRGTGLSDRVTDTPTLEERMEDVHAVMQAAGSTSAVLIGYSEGGPMCVLFAATYPEMARGIVMIGSYPRRTRTEGFPIGPSAEDRDLFLDQIEENWGKPFALEQRAPSVLGDRQFEQWWARFLRMSTSPAAAVALTKANAEIDVRDILPAVRVPTLLLHATNDLTCPVEFSRYMAEKIPGAQLVEIDAGDHLPWLEGHEQILAEIEEFVTGSKGADISERTLCTILFTDIVGSTQMQAQLGDRRWRDLLDAHNAEIRRDLAVFKGREMNMTGDGFVAIFDGPARGVQCALAIREALPRLGVTPRLGLHCGECEIRGDELSGLAIHIASRISDLAPDGEVLVSRTVKDLVSGSGLRFADFGRHRLAGVPDAWELYRAL